MRRVLVLNQDFTPLTICSVERAFVLLYLNKAELLNEVEGKHLRTISTTFPYPSVVRIFNYAHVPYRGVVMTRHNIFRRDEFKCQYCGSESNLTLDHLIPRSKGGKSNWSNLVTACKTCNAKKGDNTPEASGMKLHKNPVKPSYLMFLRKSITPFNEEWLRYLEPKAYA